MKKILVFIIFASSTLSFGMHYNMSLAAAGIGTVKNIRKSEIINSHGHQVITLNGTVEKTDWISITKIIGEKHPSFEGVRGYTLPIETMHESLESREAQYFFALMEKKYKEEQAALISLNTQPQHFEQSFLQHQ